MMFIGYDVDKATFRRIHATKIVSPLLEAICYNQDYIYCSHCEGGSNPLIIWGDCISRTSFAMTTYIWVCASVLITSQKLLQKKTAKKMLLHFRSSICLIIIYH